MTIHDNSVIETIRQCHVWNQRTHQPTFACSQGYRERKLVGEESILHSQLSLTPCHDS